MDKIRILLADDHKVVRQGLQSLLALEPDLEVVAEAGSGAEALALLDTVQPDVMLLDLKMPDIGGIEVCRRATVDHPDVPVLILTAISSEWEVLECVEAGAKGYVLKDVDIYDLVRAIHAVRRGESVLDPKVTGVVLRKMASGGRSAEPEMVLTRDEKAIVRLVAQGLTNKEIGQVLSLSPNTVKFHISNIMHRLGVRRRAEVVFKASTTHLI